MKKREYISERIINISELENILERERLLIAVLNQELEMELPDMKKVKEIANGDSLTLLLCSRKEQMKNSNNR